MPHHHSLPVAVWKPVYSDVPARAGELGALRRAAYRLETEPLNDERIPQLSETPAQLVATGLEWHVILNDGGIIAAVTTSGTAEGLLDRQRLVVDPAHHRRGLGSTQAESVNVEAAVVMTGQAKAPARHLYERLGSRHIEDHEVLQELWVSTYARGAAQPSAAPKSSHAATGHRHRTRATEPPRAPRGRPRNAP